MKYFYPSLHTLHKPSIDLSDGLPGYKHLEVATRVDAVLKGLLSAYEADVIYVDSCSSDEVRTIHDDDYVDFLLNISKELEEEEEYIPPVFRKNLNKAPLYFRGGMYCTEIGTPIGKYSVKAGLNSAQTTLRATSYVLESKKNAFVITRPPGHHAGRRRYGGYCFFNNAYLGANMFVNAGKKVVVLDIDYHIGDGSIEFAKKDMPYYSLHANIYRNYPYLDADFKNENENVFLVEFQTGISGERYVEYVKDLLFSAIDESVDIVILSLGFDTLGTDYCQDEYIYVTPLNFKTIGELFGKLNQNVLILLEGGYDSDNLEECANQFMSGFINESR